MTYTATDDAGHTTTCSFNVIVLDTTAPIVSSGVASISPLGPVNNNLVNVGLAASASDNCDGSALPITVEVFSDEDDLVSARSQFSPDAKGFSPDALRLRIECERTGDGRVYLIVVKAVDAAGNVGFSCETVTVVTNLGPNSLSSIAAQAAAARTYCESNHGLPPTGYFIVGDGPVKEPKQ